MHNIDEQEIARFSSQAKWWWDRRGQFKALHQINPVRVDYVVTRAAIPGCRVLDVGCGGGLLSEALAQAGGRVTGIDMAPPALAVAREHAAQSGLQIQYHQSTAEEWVQEKAGCYDVVTCMELVEHVPDPAALVATCARLLRPGGDLFFATVNRSWIARLLVIWASEYILGIVAKGTHTYRKFVRPEELKRWGRAAGLDCRDISGLRYLPFVGHAGLSRNTAMNYLMHFRRPGQQSF